MDFRGLLTTYSQRANDPNSFFEGKTFDDIGKDEQLTAYLRKRLDPDGTKYGSDIEALKQGFLNDYTFRSSSISGSLLRWGQSGNWNTDEKNFNNVIDRLYETAPNRLFSGDAGQTADALKAGVGGGLIGTGGGDLIINLLTAPISLGAKGLQAIGTRLLASDVVKDAAAQGLAHLSDDAAKQLAKQGMWAGAKSGAKREGALNFALGAGGEYAEQRGDVNAGLRTDTSLGEAAVGGALSGGIGAGIGAVLGGVAGRNVGKEVAGTRPLSTMAKMPEGAPRTYADVFDNAMKEKTAAFDASVDEAAKARGAADIDAIRENAQEYSTSAYQFAREVEQNVAKSKWKADTLDQLAVVIGRFGDPSKEIASEMKLAEAAFAAGDKEAYAQHLRRAGIAQRMGEVLEQLNPVDGGHFGRVDADVDPMVMRIAASVDDDLAALVARDTAPPPAAATPPAGGAPSSPAAGPNAGSPAPSAPANPAGASAAGTPSPQPTPPQPSATSAQPTTASGAAEPNATAAAPVVEPPAAETLSPQGQAAHKALNDIAVKAGTDADTLVARVAAGEPAGVVAREISQATHTPRGPIKEALATIYADVVKRKQEAASAAPAAKPDAAKVEGAPPAAGPADGAGAPPPAAGASPAKVETPSAPVAAAQPAAVPDAPANIGEWTKTIVAELAAGADRAVTVVSAALPRLNGLADEARLAEATKIVGELMQEDEALYRRITPKILAAKNAEKRIAQITRENAEAAATAIYADALGRYLPNPLDFEMFGRIMHMVPNMPAGLRDRISGNYRKMVEIALADELGKPGIGKVDALRKKYGAVVDALYGSRGSVRPVNVNLDEVMTELVDGKNLTQEQYVKVKRIVKDFRKELANTPFADDIDLMSAALRSRAASAIDDVMTEAWKANNPDVVQRMANLKADAQFARDTSIWWTGGLEGTQGALFHPSRLIVERLNPGNQWSGGDFVSGRILTRGNDLRAWARKNGKILPSGKLDITPGQYANLMPGLSDADVSIAAPQGILQNTHGMGYFGALWSQPSKAYGAMRNALLEIGKAAISASSDRRMTIKVGSETLAGTEREVKGFMLETLVARIEQARWDALISAARKLDEGGDEAAWQASLTRLGNHGRPITNEEIAAARNYVRVAKEREIGIAKNRATLADLAEKAAEGIDTEKLFADAFARMNAMMARLDDNLFKATDALTSPAGKDGKKRVSGGIESAQDKASAKAAGKGKLDQKGGDLKRKEQFDEEIFTGKQVKIEAVTKEVEIDDLSGITPLDRTPPSDAEMRAAYNSGETIEPPTSGQILSMSPGGVPLGAYVNGKLFLTKEGRKIIEGADAMVRIDDDNTKLAKGLSNGLRVFETPEGSLGKKMKVNRPDFQSVTVDGVEVARGQMKGDNYELTLTKNGQKVTLKKDTAAKDLLANPDFRNAYRDEYLAKAGKKIDDVIEGVDPKANPKDRIALQAEDGSVRELDPNDLRFDGEGSGNVVFLGRTVGTWAVGADGKAMTVNIAGLDTPFEGVKNGVDLVKRKRFLKSQKSLINGKAPDMPKADPAVANVAKEGDTIPAGATRSEEIEAAKEALTGKPATDAEMAAPFDQMEWPSKRRRALLDTKSGRIWRVKEGQNTVAEVAGQHAEPGRFVIGTVPWSQVSKATGRKVDPFNDQAFLQAEFRPLGSQTRPMTRDELAHFTRESRSKNTLPEIAQAKAGPAPMSLLSKIESPVSGKKMSSFIDEFDADAIEWYIGEGSTLDQLDAFIADMEKRAATINSVAPHGYVRTNASRRTSFARLQEALQKRTPEEINAALDVLRRLDADAKQYPYIAPSDKNSFLHGAELPWAKQRRGSYVKLNEAGMTEAPPHIVVAHEVAHWAFYNVLTPDEKLAFLRSLRKYFAEDGSITPFRDKYGSVLLKANEIFANEFTTYVQQMVRKEQAGGDEALWKKAIHYVKGLFQHILKKPVDPDLIPIFERIMPTQPNGTRYHKGVLRDLMSEDGALVKTVVDDAADERLRFASLKLDKLTQFDEQRRKIDDILNSARPDHVALAEYLKEYGTQMLGILYPQKTNRTKITSIIRNAVLADDGSKDTDAVRKLFGHKGLSTIMDAYRSMVGETKGEAQALGEFVDDLGRGEPVAIEVALNPEFAAQAAEIAEKARKAALAAGASEEQAHDLVWAAMKALREQLPEESRVDAAVSKETGAAIREVAVQFRDALTDAADSMALSIKDNGYAVVRDNSAVPAAPVAETAKETIKKTVQKAVKQAIDDAMDDRSYRDMVADARKAVMDANVEEGKRRSAMGLGLSHNDWLEVANRTVQEHLDKALRRISANNPVPSEGTVFKDITDPEELVGELRNAMIDGDYNSFMEAARRLRLMQQAATVAPTAKPVVDAVKREAADASAQAVSTGVPAKAPPMIGALASRITHRDPVQQDIAQQIAYRLFNLMGTDNPTDNHVRALFGLPEEPGFNRPAGTMPEDMNRLRKELRSISEYFTNKDKAPYQGVKKVIRLLEPADDDVASLAEAIIEKFRKQPRLSDNAKKLLERSMTDAKLLSAANELLEKTGYVISGLVKNDPMAVTRVAAFGDSISAAVDGGATRLANGYSPVGLANEVNRRVSLLSPDEIEMVAADIGLTGPDYGKRLLDSIVYVQNGKVSTSPTIVGSVHVEALAAKMDDGARAQAKALAQDLDRLNTAILNEKVASKVVSMQAERAGVIRALEEMVGSKLDDTAEAAFLPKNKLFGSSTSTIAAAVLAREVGLESEESVLAAIRANDPRAVYDAIVRVAGQDKVDKALISHGYIAAESADGIHVVDNSLLDKVDDVLPTERGAADPADLPTSGELLFGLTLGDYRPNSLGWQQRLIETGVPPSIARAASKLLPGGRPLTDTDTRVLEKQAGIVQFRENSRRIYKAGATWVADMIKPKEGIDFHSERNSNISRALSPALEALDKVLGINNIAWKAYDEIGRNLKGMIGKRAQSDIEDGIARAMHGNRVHALPNDQRMLVSQHIDPFFRNLLKRQRDAGVQVGDITGNGITHYLPQRFDLNWLAENTDEAIKRYAKAFAEVEKRPYDEAFDSARKMVHRALEDYESSGFIETVNSQSRLATNDLYARVLRFTDEQKVKYGLIDTLDTNLKSLMIGYAQAAETRIAMHKRFGQDMHGYKVYRNIATDGRDAVIDALTNGETRRERQGIAQNVEGLDVGAEVQFLKPLFRDPAEAAAFADRMINDLTSPNAGPGDRKAYVTALERLYADRGLPSREEFRVRAEAIVNGVADFGVRGVGIQSDELRFMDRMVQTLGGRPAYMGDHSKAAKRAAGGLMAFNSVTLLPMAVMASLSDSILPLLRSGDASAYIKGIASTIKGITDPAHREAIANTGVAVEAILNENVTSLHGGLTGKASTAFFWANGLIPWTKIQRELSAAVGFEAIRAQQIIAKRERAMGNVDGWAYRAAVRKLRQLGAADLVNQPELTTLIAARNNDMVLQAIHRFADESVFQPNRNDIPLWGQDPIRKVFMQLKSYPIMMGRFVRRAVTEAVAAEKNGQDLGFLGSIKGLITGEGKYAGDPRGLLYLLSVGAGAGLLVSYLRDIVQGRNQEAGARSDWRSPRDYKLSKIAEGFGVELDIDSETLDRFLGSWLQGMVTLGSLGMVGDLMYQSAQQVDNGAYGRQRIASLIFGPSVGTMNDMLTVVEGAHQAVTGEEGDPNGKQRQAVRMMVKRVPFLGSQQQVVEDIVDNTAGEAQAQAK